MQPPTDQFDPLDQRLLNELQAGVPLTADPFAVLADRLGGDADDLLARVRRMKERKVVRQISGIFDTRALGYVGSLVAAKYEPSRLEAAAEVVSAHPGVSHNYERNHPFNLWYTLAVPPDSRLGLERTVDLLHAQSAAQATRLLPTLRLFKIGVKFDMTGSRQVGEQADDDTPAYSEADQAAAAQHPVTDRDKAMIRALQRDLPLTREPFAELARGEGVAADELLAAAARFLDRRQMRRFAAVIRHRQAGFGANAMGVWAVPEGRIDEVGRQLAAFKAVSHCYLRPSYPDWPYNIFTMVHARSKEECEAELAAMADATGITQRGALYSTREFKKVRVKYFVGDTEAWEATHGNVE
ncbi:MAG: hypothetical protein BIFFINMI_01003 [Phycisphaerae bacterium]|nr:hypothetical protein [Phycisphaerae bacterium]